LEVLFDDREESPGVKFNDADLLGIPLRVTISPRTLEKNSVELKWRSEKEAQLVPLDGVVAKLKELVKSNS
jgi:prolyl-tRNA synthetase